MKYIIKVENIQNLPLTNPLMAIDNNGSCQRVPRIPNNEIWYTSSNGQVVNPYSTSGWPEFTNIYENGKGVIKFTSNITSVGSQAFYNCSGLTSVTIPASVTSIGISAFYKCTGLTSITIPNSVTSIGNQAFSQCSGLTSVMIGNSVTSIGRSAFSGCTNLSAVTIPGSVTSIGNGAFSGCTGLISMAIPNNVTSIGNNAFYNCSGLTSIACKATTPPTLGTSALSNTNKCPIFVPSQSVDDYKAATNWSEYANRIQAIQQ